MSDDTTNAGSDLVNAIGSAVRDNPLPAALIGIGILWLFTGGRGPAKAGLGAAADGLSPMGGRVSEQAASAGRTIADTVASAADSVRSGVVSMANATTAPEGGRSALRDLFQRQPLLLGAIGMGIGAGVGASMASTDTEKQYFGDASAEFQAKALGAAKDGAQRASNIASGVATAIANEARVQGLTADALQSSVTDAARKIKLVADQASEAVQTRMR
jgi:hypothetical protein